MDASAAVTISITMRASDDEISGTFTAEGAEPVAFAGWLELLRHLESAGDRAVSLASGDAATA